jgi:TonB-dependent SusC/RagA subfamily outer membrane receptor
MRSPRSAALAGALFGALAALAVLSACGSGGVRPARYTPPPSETEGSRTSSVSSVSGDAMRQAGPQRIEEFLNGRVPGLRVERNESGQLSIRIRGSASLGKSDEEPLVVVDGMPTPQGMNSEVLRMLDPREVHRVEVLKDASTTAMYGSRGANGVLVIRTRSASRR